MIANISPEAQYTDESISTCHFAQRVAQIKNSASVNEKVDPELVIQRLRAEVRRLREEVDFLSGKKDDDVASCDGGNHDNSKFSQELMNEMTESIKKYVNNSDTNSHLDFCGGITLPRIHAACSIFKDMLIRASFDKALTKETAADDDDSDAFDGDDDLTEKNGQSKYKMKNVRGAKIGCRHVGVILRSNATKMTSPHEENTKIISNTVCGVPVCRDNRVVDEPNLAFEWFKERYPGLASIDEYKNTLKAKYSEVICHLIKFSKLLVFVHLPTNSSISGEEGWNKN